MTINQSVWIFRALQALIAAAERVGAAFHVKHSSDPSAQGSRPGERPPTRFGSASTRVPTASSNPQSYPQRYPPLFPRVSAAPSTGTRFRNDSSLRASGRADAASAEPRPGPNGDPMRAPGLRTGSPVTVPPGGKSLCPWSRRRSREEVGGRAPLNTHIQRVPGSETAPRDP